MFLGAGVGAFVASIFHLMTHAFFKACLFLGSGSVIHAMGGEQDVQKMGGLKKWMPVTYITFLLSTLAIAGIPPFAGFFSKDEILFSALASRRGVWVLWVVGSIAAFFTAFYMFRLVFLTFFGTFRGTHEREPRLRESPRSMTVPLMVLATLAIIGGWIGIPRFMVFGADVNLFERALHPVVGYHGAPLAEIEAAQAARVVGAAEPFVIAGLPGAGAAFASHEGGTASAAAEHGDQVAEAGSPEHAAPGGAHAEEEHAGAEHAGNGVEAMAHFSTIAEWGLVALAVLVAVGGIGLAYYLYRVRLNMPGSIAASIPPLYRLIANKYYVDELYDAIVLKPFYGWCAFFSWLDRRLVDGAVNGARHLTVALSYASNFVDRWVVDLGVNGVGAFVRGGSWVLRRAQTGLVQNYAAAMIFGSFVLLGIYLVYAR